VTRLRLSYAEQPGQPEKALGVLVVDEAHMVRALPAEPRFAAPLKEIESEINRMRQLHVEAPPPEPSERFESWARIVERGSDEFVPALKEVLGRAFGLTAVDEATVEKATGGEAE